MKFLILGGDGMLGHQLLKYLTQNGHEVKVTLRNPLDAYAGFRLFNAQNAYAGINILNSAAVEKVLMDFRPDVVINAVGIVKQRPLAIESIPSIEINALFPHRLAQWCQTLGARVIHMSTDCVFSGKKGAYTEEDFPDAYDLYGRSKFLGELHEEHCLTIRSSIIGLELSRKTSLIEWFLAQQGSIRGFQKAIYTGVTTLEMSRIIEKFATQWTNLHGVWQIASEPISKYELLIKFAEKLGREITIIPDTDFHCDRSLSGKRFLQATGYQIPKWDVLLSELASQYQQQLNEVVA